MKWNPEDENDSRIMDVSIWKPIGAHRQLKALAGVFIFADARQDVKYIGKAGEGRMVLEQLGYETAEVAEIIAEVYNAKYRKKDTGAMMMKILYTLTGAIALELEGELIKKYSPANNGVRLND